MVRAKEGEREIDSNPAIGIRTVVILIFASSVALFTKSQPMSMQLQIHLASVGLPLVDGRGVEERLIGLRQMYEPYILALSKDFSLALPTWLPGHQSVTTGRPARETAAVTLAGKTDCNYLTKR